MSNRRLTPDEALQEMMRPALAVAEFKGEFTDEFKKLLHKALRFCGLAKMGCEMFTYVNMLTFERPFLMPEVYLMIKVLEGSTPNEMEVSFHDYVLILKEFVQPLKKVWEAQELEIAEPFRREINAKLKLESGVPIGKQVFKLS